MNNGQTPLTLSLRVGGGDCAAARWPLFLKRHRDNESSPFKLSPPLPLTRPIHTLAHNGWHDFDSWVAPCPVLVL